MFTEALLSYIGLGPPPPSPSWGRIISESFSYLQVAPYYVLFPALALSLTLLAFNFFGDGLRDAFDPRRAN
jgi:ABC-type dipeptide/oligopeptide/nickel transport system permease subunit